MKIEVLVDSGSVAQRAASIIAEEARKAVAARGRFVIAVSGGHTPWLMLRAWREDVPWEAIHIFQVDERVAPAGHPDRNLTHSRELCCLMPRCPPDRSMRCPSNELISRGCGTIRYRT